MTNYLSFHNVMDVEETLKEHRMTKKFVNSEWVQINVNDPLAKTVSVSDYNRNIQVAHVDLLDVFQSFEDRIQELTDKVNRNHDDACENAAHNFTRFSNVQHTIDKLESNMSIEELLKFKEDTILELVRRLQLIEGKFYELFDSCDPKSFRYQITELQQENKFLRDDVNYLREKLLGKEETTIIKGYRFHEGPKPIVGYEKFITRDGLNFMAGNVLDKTEPTKPQFELPEELFDEAYKGLYGHIKPKPFDIPQDSIYPDFKEYCRRFAIDTNDDMAVRNAYQDYLAHLFDLGAEVREEFLKNYEVYKQCREKVKPKRNFEILFTNDEVNFIIVIPIVQIKGDDNHHLVHMYEEHIQKCCEGFMRCTVEEFNQALKEFKGE